MLLTDHLLLDYKRCQRRAFLNVHGNPAQRDPERDFLLKLRQESQKHIAEILRQFYPHHQQPQASYADWQGRAKETEALMQQGIECIYQGVLTQSGEFEGGDVTLRGMPTLLVKQQGKSNLGDWLYYPLNIQLGRRPKAEYKIVAAFHAYLLATTQGIVPATSRIILRRQNDYLLDLDYWLPRLEDALAECVQMLRKGEEPEVFISRQRCSLCHWYSHCYAIAQTQQHLSLVPGVTPNRYEYLQSLGVATLESLAAACPINMGEVIGVDIASQLQQQAQSILENRAIVKSPQVWQHYGTIPTASLELYFDIEAEPERNLDYLLGIFLVDRQSNTEQFYPFLAENPEHEGDNWQRVLDFLWQYENAPIFHFSEYEGETLKRLAQLYHTPSPKIEPLLARCVDLHRWVIRSVTLPVESYSLKSLANWLGFHWRDRGVSGDQTVCWYDQWLTTGDRRLLEAILRYNEDDCRATHHLKQWLVQFLLEY